LRPPVFLPPEELRPPALRPRVPLPRESPPREPPLCEPVRESSRDEALRRWVERWSSLLLELLRRLPDEDRLSMVVLSVGSEVNEAPRPVACGATHAIRPGASLPEMRRRRGG
jgi:hypothetical protein